MKTIKLSNSESVVLVSDADFARVNKYKWFLKRAKGPAGSTEKYYYAARSVNMGNKPDGRQITKTVWLHRFLKDEPEGLDVHHNNGDKLDCQQHNLEPISAVDHGSNFIGACEVPF